MRIQDIIHEAAQPQGPAGHEPPPLWYRKFLSMPKHKIPTLLKRISLLVGTPAKSSRVLSVTARDLMDVANVLKANAETKWGPLPQLRGINLYHQVLAGIADGDVMAGLEKYNSSPKSSQALLEEWVNSVVLVMYIINPEKIAEYEAYSNPGRDWYIPPSEEEIARDQAKYGKPMNWSITVRPTEKSNENT